MACPGPSLPGAFDLLAAAGREKLVILRHKLQTVHKGHRGASLLHAMVLLQLGRDAEARVSLDASKADAVARLVARQWAGMDSAEAPEDPTDVSWGIARLYHLLAEENLCPATLRDAAYQAAHQALSSCGDPRLGELRREAGARLGWDALRASGRFQPLCSSEGPLPPSSASLSGSWSLACPIEAWSHGCSLRSTGSPASLASDLEISQSPTMAFFSQPRSPHGPSKLCEQPLGPEPVPTGGQEPEEMSWPSVAEITVSPAALTSRVPEVGANPPSWGLREGSPAAPETGTRYPVECSDESTAPKSLSLPHPEPTESLCPVKDQTTPPISVEDTTPQETNPGPPASLAPETSLPLPPAPSPSSSSSVLPAPSCPPCPPSLESEASEQKFYNFVVLHAMADEDVALRVREKLEALGVPDGATFCEDFQVPGRGELRCLQDAIDHSGFIILLMTPNFNSALGLHQVNQALTSSFTHHGRYDSVIPFLPLESTPGLRGSDTSRLLSGLVWLDEHSKIFARKAGNTFKPQRLWERRAHWQREQEARARLRGSQRLDSERRQAEALHAAHAAYLRSYLGWQAQVDKLQVDFGSRLSLGTQVPYPPQGPFSVQGPWGAPPPFPGWPESPEPPAPPPGHTGSPSPAFPQPPSFPQPPACPQPTFQQPSAFPPASPASPQAPLIIHHAQMVQVGGSNRMWNQRAVPAPEDQAQDPERRSDQA
ncbi:PREDICTED: TIR domain-containing adapter molecule 1 [Chinchilla lanigera]|uniref:TIR domain-containing adapter molecule 1 n=1 Tax=Chinchilla lanigera TaxID=34839 RepID=A0A8C2W8G9_CHILA|nr:PREDICTED: TIR domain-containing adapter molecule 1 [Chinchilla lanigera]XP_005405839.1 PREDICTED: TIR domain-containing adapter molecule 1 [Chinchilla lanigera]